MPFVAISRVRLSLHGNPAWIPDAFTATQSWPPPKKSHKTTKQELSARLLKPKVDTDRVLTGPCTACKCFAHFPRAVFGVLLSAANQPRGSDLAGVDATELHTDGTVALLFWLLVASKLFTGLDDVMSRNQQVLVKMLCLADAAISS